MFVFVSEVQSCVILCQYIGECPYSGEPIPSFFAVVKLKGGRPWSGLFTDADDLVRISKNANTYNDLVGFCQGYSTAINSGKWSMQPGDWKYGPVFKDSIVVPEPKRRDELIYWPKEPPEIPS